MCINIEPGTFPDGKQQPIFFHVIYNDMYAIRDIPETNDRTLISPVIQCGPGDINPQKAMDIVIPHCLYVDEVKKGSIAVYRCEQFTNKGSLSYCIGGHIKQFFLHTKAALKMGAPLHTPPNSPRHLIHAPLRLQMVFFSSKSAHLEQRCLG